MRKNILVIEKKKLKFEAEEITRTIYSNSERSEDFWLQNAFLTCSWRFLLNNKLEQLKLEKNIGI